MSVETTSPTFKTTDIVVGDSVGRQERSDGPVLWLTVTEVDDATIYCNRWMFDRLTGAEIDHDLQWGPEYGKTGSFIKFIKKLQ